MTYSAVTKWEKAGTTGIGLCVIDKMLCSIRVMFMCTTELQCLRRLVTGVLMHTNGITVAAVK